MSRSTAPRPLSAPLPPACPLTRRQLLHLGLALSLGSLSGCQAGSGAPGATTTPDPQALLARGETIASALLLREAQREGTLSTIALPRTWVNYGKIIDTFTERYGLAYNGLHTDYGSSQEIEAIRAHPEGGELAPDVVDIGMGYTEPAKAEGLFAPYKVATWDTIPDALKDPEGYWYGDYYGVMGFQVSRTNVKNVPQSWEELLKPEYKDMIALAGNPNESSTAIHAVWAAGLARTGSLDDAPAAGIEFFMELNRAGNFLPTAYTPETIASGDTPIVIHWDYVGLGNRDALQDQIELEVVIPESSVLGGAYAQAISAYAPHPFAARLWEEFLYSDEGQLLWLEGYTHPVRYADLVARNKIPAELAAKLPPAAAYARATFPTVAQTTAATEFVPANWHRVIEARPR
ncbi:MAG: ABC transporter substrate-binding protein [Ardenticatenales bacterium]|nr:ABC transporter substrate-binding protein [Ardenticatenales bacterium]